MKAVNFILLAGGKGSRMQSSIPKVLHPIKDTAGNLCSFERIVNLIRSLDGIKKNIYAVISPEINENPIFRSQIPEDIYTIVQREQRGTGHAVQMISGYLDRSAEDCIIIYCDHPLIQAGTIYAILEALNRYSFCNLSFFREGKNNYGKSIIADILNEQERMIIETISDQNVSEFYLKTLPIQSILEAKDTPDSFTGFTKLCNAGINVKTEMLLKYINLIEKSEQTQEIYLTKLPQLINLNEAKDNSMCTTLIVPEFELMAFNTIDELREIEKFLQK